MFWNSSENASSNASPSNAKPKITLEVSGVEYTEPKRFNFDSEIMIGRENVSDIILQQATVSAGHANIIPLNGKWYLRDFNSTNGTYLNGIKYKNNEPIQLNSGDNIKITNHNIKVISINSEETNAFGNPSNTSSGGFFGGGGSSTPSGGSFGGFGGRRRSF